MGALRRLRDVAAASLACALTICGLRALTPPPAEYGLGAKLEHFADHRDEFDVVYLGSSRVFRSFIPAVIDARLAELGCDVRSYNLGVPGMDDFEADALLRDVLALKPARLRWIVLEPGLFDPRIYGANRFTARTLEWHTWRGTSAALDATDLLAAPDEEKDELTWTHLAHWGRRALNLGQGRRIAARALLGEPEEEHGLSEAVLEEGRGYLALEGSPGEEVARRRAELLADPASYQARVARIEAQRAARPPLDDYPLAVLAAQIDAVRASGAEPVYVLPPASQARSKVYSLRDAGYLPQVLDFSSPAQYPDLFAVEGRFDANHLRRESAERFSRLFAERFAELLAAKPAE